MADLGYEPETACDALDCLAKLRRSNPALLVLDVGLLWGGADGVLTGGGAGAGPSFEGKNLQELISQIVSGEPPPLQMEGVLAEQLALLVSRCLAKQPSQRFKGFTEIAAELKRIQRLAGDDASGSLKLDRPIERESGASSGTIAAESKPVQPRQKTPLEDFTQSGEIRTPAGDNLIPAIPVEAFRNPVPTGAPPPGAGNRVSPLFILGLVLLAVILAGIFLL